MKCVKKFSASNGVRAMALGRARLILRIFKIPDFRAPFKHGNIALKCFLSSQNVGEQKALNVISIILRSHAFLSNISIFSEFWNFMIFGKICYFSWKSEKSAIPLQKCSGIFKKSIFSNCFKMLQNRRKSFKNGREKSQRDFKSGLMHFQCLLDCMQLQKWICNKCCKIGWKLLDLLLF